MISKKLCRWSMPMLTLVLLLAACGSADSGDGDAAASFQVDGSEATMTGVIGSSTPDSLRELLEQNPQVDTIVMIDVPGSEDDVANIEAAELVHRANIATHVPSDGQIASGGVDFFLAGAERTYEVGAEFGVHSWANGQGRTGDDIPRDDPEHDLFLDFYDSIDVSEDFYWFTLGAAPAEDIHIMTDDELDRFAFGDRVDN